MWGGRVPLDPIPVVDLADHVEDPRNLYVAVSAGKAIQLRSDLTEIYRVHNDGKCIHEVNATRLA